MQSHKELKLEGKCMYFCMLISWSALPSLPTIPPLSFFLCFPLSLHSLSFFVSHYPSTLFLSLFPTIPPLSFFLCFPLSLRSLSFFVSHYPSALFLSLFPTLSPFLPHALYHLSSPSFHSQFSFTLSVSHVRIRQLYSILGPLFFIFLIMHTVTCTIHTHNTHTGMI